MQCYKFNIKDCLYTFRPLLGLIRMHSQHYKEILNMYVEDGLSTLNVTSIDKQQQ
jgi:hypothetical protein